jgi:hypothetical protein
MCDGTIVQNVAIVVLIAFGTTCGGTGPTMPSQQRVANGQWGGQHVGMEVNDSGAQLEFDCAHGRIDGAIALTESGRFEAKGTYTQERPGPRREDEENARVVRYSGRIDGKSMTLTIDAGQNSSDAIANYTLELGKTPVIRKCL